MNSTSDRSQLPGWHPDHCCGIFCDGQDGNGHCSDEKRNGDLDLFDALTVEGLVRICKHPTPLVGVWKKTTTGYTIKWPGARLNVTLTHYDIIWDSGQTEIGEWPRNEENAKFVAKKLAKYLRFDLDQPKTTAPLAQAPAAPVVSLPVIPVVLPTPTTPQTKSRMSWWKVLPAVVRFIATGW